MWPPSRQKREGKKKKKRFRLPRKGKSRRAVPPGTGLRKAVKKGWLPPEEEKKKGRNTVKGKTSCRDQALDLPCSGRKKEGKKKRGTNPCPFGKNFEPWPRPGVNFPGRPQLCREEKKNKKIVGTTRSRVPPHSKGEKKEILPRSKKKRGAKWCLSRSSSPKKERRKTKRGEIFSGEEGCARHVFHRALSCTKKGGKKRRFAVAGGTDGEGVDGRSEAPPLSWGGKRERRASPTPTRKNLVWSHPRYMQCSRRREKKGKKKKK